MKRMTMGLLLMAAPALLGPQGSLAQVVETKEWQCEGGVTKGDLGISGLDCRGECTLTMNEKGEEQAWSFTVEPRIIGITPEGPAVGVLRVGDILVAIDGILITTREGGIRYARVDPGEDVVIRFRRDGQLTTGRIRSGSTCPLSPPRLLSPAPLFPPTSDTLAPLPPLPPRTVTAGRLAHPVTPQPALPDTAPPARRAMGVAVAPRVRVTIGPDTVEGRAVASVRPARPVGVPSPPAMPARPGVPEGRLGISFSCSDCSGEVRGGVQIWEFSGPIEVIGVDPGGPADQAGIQLGDQVTAVNGRRIESRQGGEEFSKMTPGESLELTVVKRSGREETVSVVPVTSETLAQARRVVASTGVSRRAVAAAPAPTTPLTPPTVSSGVELPAPTAGIAPPEGMPLRYSGTLEGVEVEVRGDPVTVSEMRGARTILINSAGIWIRITIPPGGLPSPSTP